MWHLCVLCNASIPLTPNAQVDRHKLLKKIIWKKSSQQKTSKREVRKIPCEQALSSSIGHTCCHKVERFLCEQGLALSSSVIHMCWLSTNIHCTMSACPQWLCCAHVLTHRREITCEALSRIVWSHVFTHRREISCEPITDSVGHTLWLIHIRPW